MNKKPDSFRSAFHSIQTFGSILSFNEEVFVEGYIFCEDRRYWIQQRFFSADIPNESHTIVVAPAIDSWNAKYNRPAIAGANYERYWAGGSHIGFPGCPVPHEAIAAIDQQIWARITRSAG